MISKKVRIASATAVLAAVGFGITSAASARFGETVVEKSGRTERIAPMHDRRDGDHLEAAATALGMTSAEVKTQLQSGKSLAEIATSKGVAVQKVIDAIVADVKAEIAEKVTDGKLTQAQADTMITGAESKVTSIVNGEVPFGRGHEKLRDRHHMFGDHLEAAATALGMTSAEVKTQLQSGKSLAEIATSQGVAVQKVIDAIVADVKAEIAEKVTDGKLTQAQADTMLKDVTVRVTAAVNGEVPLGHGPRMHGGDHGKHGGRHDHDESEETTEFPGSDA